MSSGATATLALDPPVRREEILPVALLLAFAGGYIDTYTWITHGVFANAQTTNLVLLWVNAAATRWRQAFHFVPPLAAFSVGIVIAAWLRRSVGQKAGRLSLIIEVGMLIFVGILHNRMPAVSGTLGISLVAAMQSSVFTKVEGMVYSSVMITGNFRQAIEGAFALAAGDRHAGVLRKPSIYMGVCAAFGTGAAVGALLTEWTPTITLGLPVAALLLVLLFCKAPLAVGESQGQPGNK